MLGIKQEALPEQAPRVLKVSVDAIKNFDEESAVKVISNTASFENCEQPAKLRRTVSCIKGCYRQKRKR